MIPLLHRAVSKLGLVGLIALCSLILSAAFYAVTVRPLEDESAHLDRQLRRGFDERPRDKHDAKAVRTSLITLAPFYQFFERKDRLEDWLSKIYASAIAAGLDWRTAEYKLVESRYRLARYQITLPISGSYPQVRSFLDAALVEVPIMAVDQITFRRKSVGDPRIDVELVMTLYLPAR